MIVTKIFFNFVDEKNCRAGNTLKEFVKKNLGMAATRVLLLGRKEAVYVLAELGLLV
jgi:hypothetical protein